ncbi:hypothetical protein AUC68_03240 [Methyloceanibacter methanicus]|uniref:Uncharacterized protein n=1 Tax=Methyloceanibacter methanicus TaxID=1774968 RepID=A0A1E3W319_9HYPH|nr:hypothetical protein AUC68_03240 [Methyloceanibacter methanicus]
MRAWSGDFTLLEDFALLEDFTLLEDLRLLSKAMAPFGGSVAEERLSHEQRAGASTCPFHRRSR